MFTNQKQQTSRARLLAEMERLFADDAGLGVLVPYNGRPDLTQEVKDTRVVRVHQSPFSRAWDGP